MEKNVKKYGLPTFPIAEGMDVGERDGGELQWLLLHGYFISSPVGSFLKIEKSGDGYVLLRGSHERHLAAHGEECLLGPIELQQLLQSKPIRPVLARWQWFENEEKDGRNIPLGALSVTSIEDG